MSTTTSLNSQGGPSLSAPPTSTTSTVGYSTNSTASTTKESHHLLNKVAAAMPLLPPLPTASTTEASIDHTKHAAGNQNMTWLTWKGPGRARSLSAGQWAWSLICYHLLTGRQIDSWPCQVPFMFLKSNFLVIMILWKMSISNTILWFNKVQGRRS